MKNVLSTSFLICLLGMVFLSSCTPDVASLETSDISGKWEVQSGERNGKPMQTAEGFFFQFNEDGTAMSNFNMESSDKNYAYELKDGKISFKGDEELDMSAEKTLENEIILNTSFAGSKFKLVLVPAKEKAPEEEIGGGETDSDDGH